MSADGSIIVVQFKEFSDAPPLSPHPPSYLSSYPPPSYESAKTTDGYHRLPADLLDVHVQTYRPHCFQSCFMSFLLFMGLLLSILCQMPQLPFLEARCDPSNNQCQTALVALSPWFFANYTYPPQYHLLPLPTSPQDFNPTFASDYFEDIRPDAASFLDFLCGDRYGGSPILTPSTNCGLYIGLRLLSSISVIATMFAFFVAIIAFWDRNRALRSVTSVMIAIAALCGGLAFILGFVLSSKDISLDPRDALSSVHMGVGAWLMGVETVLLLLLLFFNVCCQGQKVGDQRNEDSRCCSNCCQCLCGCCTIMMVICMLAFVGTASAFLLLAARGPRPYTFYPTNSNATYQLYMNPVESRLFLSNSPDVNVMFSASKSIHGMPNFITAIDVVPPNDPKYNISLKFKMQTFYLSPTSANFTFVRLLNQATGLGTTFSLNWDLSKHRNLSNAISINIQSPTGLLNFNTPVFALDLPPLDPILPKACLAYNFSTTNISNVFAGANFTITDGDSFVDDAIVHLTVTKRKPSKSVPWITDSQQYSVPNYGGGFYFVSLPMSAAPSEADWVASYENNTEYQINNTCQHLSYLQKQLSGLCRIVDDTVNSVLAQPNVSESMKQEGLIVKQACQLIFTAWGQSCEHLFTPELNIFDKTIHSKEKMIFQNINVNQLGQVISTADKVETFTGDTFEFDVSYYRKGFIDSLQSWQITVDPRVQPNFPATMLYTSPKPTCNDLSQAGNDLPSVRSIDVGLQAASLSFRYNTYTVPDQMDVYYQGKLLYSSGCVGTVVDVLTPLSYYGISSSLTVAVTPNCEGTTSTGWDYTLMCPAKTEMKCDCGILNCKCQCTDGTKTWNNRQVTPATYDGCGSVTSRTGSVPQEIVDWLGFGQGFGACCNDHDICYGSCGPTERSLCDDLMDSCLSDYCRTVPFLEKSSCLLYRTVYVTIVRYQGTDAFKEAQRQCTCDPAPSST